LDAELLPGFGGGVFSCEGCEERGDGCFYPVGFGIEIRQEGRVFNHGNAGFWSIGCRKVVDGQKMRGCKKKKGCKKMGEGRASRPSGDRNGMERKGRHEVIKMQESGVLSNWGERLAGWQGRERTEIYGVFCRND